MNDDKLECLRLATEVYKNLSNSEGILKVAQQFYDWIYEQEKINSLTFEKISKERE